MKELKYLASPLRRGVARVELVLNLPLRLWRNFPTGLSVEREREVEVPNNDSKLGPIRIDAVYPLPIFKTLTGQSDWAVRIARRRGLKVRSSGRRSYVIGREWAEYIANQK